MTTANSNSTAQTGQAPTTPGVYPGLSFDDYLQIPAVNASSLKPWLISPKYAKWREANPVETDSTMLGQAIHSYTLDDDFHEKYAALDDTQLIEEILEKRPDLKTVRNSKDYKDAVKNFADLNKHKTILKWDQMQTVVNSKRAIVGHPPVTAMHIDEDDAELTLVWQEQELGTLCKARLDCFNKQTGRITDLKTMAKRPTVRAVERQVIDYAYHIQYAWYMRGVRALHLHQAPWLRFIFVQTCDEFDVTVADPDEAMLDQGWRDAKRALAEMQHAQAIGEYRGVHPDPVSISLPDWAFDDTEIIDDGTEVAE